MKQVHLIISGDVQNVGFRHWLKSIADAHSVTGWVQNREDDTVEALLYGEGAMVQAVEKLCHQGPETASVSDVQREEQQPGAGHTIFKIVS